MGEEYGMLQFTYSVLRVCLGFHISEAASALKTPNPVECLWTNTAQIGIEHAVCVVRYIFCNKI